METSFLLFLGIAAIVIVAPGQDTALTLRNAIAGGRSAGMATAIGVAAGQLVWAISAALGLVAVLAATETLFTAIKYAGAAYLVFLGLQSLQSALARPTLAEGGETHRQVRRLSAKRAFTQGLVSNLGNPKMAVFFASLLPQFAPVGSPAFATMLGLGAIFCAMTLVWLGFYSIAVTWLGEALRRPVVRRIVDGITGVALVGFGLRVSVLDR